MSALDTLSARWLGQTRDDRVHAEFEVFVDANTDGLLRTAYLVVWDTADAEDVVQECLLQVARRWPRVRSMDNPLGYARRILINVALDGSDRRARERLGRTHLDDGALEAQPDHGAAGAYGQVDARLELRAALARLPPRQRAVLVLRYFDDLSEAQVARALGCSLGTVKSTASRGLDRLRLAMNDTPDRADRSAPLSVEQGASSDG